MDICNFLTEILNTNSTFFAFVSLLASFGTIAALIYTMNSINESRRESKKESAKKSLDLFFNNLDNSLNSLIFYAWTGPNGPETHFGKNAIYRVIVHPFISGITAHTHNYSALGDYLEYVHITSNSIKELTKELKNENLANFYYDRLNREIVFLTEALPIVINHAVKYEKIRHKDENICFLNGLLYRINDIKGIGLYSRKDTFVAKVDSNKN